MLNHVKPVVQLEDRHHSRVCFACGNEGGVRAIVLGHEFTDHPGGNTGATALCEGCRRLLLIALLEELPGFPCGFEESEVIVSPLFKGAVVRMMGGIVASPDEAFGIAADALKAAIEAEKR